MVVNGISLEHSKERDYNASEIQKFFKKEKNLQIISTSP